MSLGNLRATDWIILSLFAWPSLVMTGRAGWGFFRQRQRRRSLRLLAVAWTVGLLGGAAGMLAVLAAVGGLTWLTGLVHAPQLLTYVAGGIVALIGLAIVTLVSWGWAWDEMT